MIENVICKMKNIISTPKYVGALTLVFGFGTYQNDHQIHIDNNTDDDDNSVVNFLHCRRRRRRRHRHGYRHHQRHHNQFASSAGMQK